MVMYDDACSMAHSQWHMPHAAWIALGAHGSEFVDHCEGSHVLAL